MCVTCAAITYYAPVTASRWSSHMKIWRPIQWRRAPPRRGIRGEESDDDFYTVDTALVATMERPRASPTSSPATATSPGSRRSPSALPTSPGSGPLAYLLRVGSFPSKEEAAELQAQLKEAGCGGGQGDVAYKTPKAVYTGEDGGELAGPWVSNILEVAPALATDVIPKKEALTGIASRASVPATVNGGYS